jgi:hypothetical protein
VGAVAAQLCARTMQAPPWVIAVRFPVVVVQYAEVQTIVPEASFEEASAAPGAPGAGGDPGKAANPAAQPR